MSLVRLLTLGTSELALLPNLKCLDQFHEFRDDWTIQCDTRSSASNWTAYSEWGMSYPALNPWPHLSYAWNGYSKSQLKQHQPISLSHFSPSLSLKEQEWGRTREKMKIGNGDEGGRWSEGMQSKIIISSRSSHPYLMIMVSSWAIISLVEDFSQTLISTSHACMDHGVWWPLIHHKGKGCSTPYNGV